MKTATMILDFSGKSINLLICREKSKLIRLAIRARPGRGPWGGPSRGRPTDDPSRGELLMRRMTVLSATAGLVVILALSVPAVSSDPAPPAQTDPPQSTPSSQERPQANQDASQQKGGRRGQGPGSSPVYKSQITPHWFQNNTRFWYRNDLRG